MNDYKILTPKFRAEINQSFDNMIDELRECEQNGLVVARIEGLMLWKKYIGSLPDGVPIPVKKVRNEL